jgi:hypothetical protein
MRFTPNAFILLCTIALTLAIVSPTSADTKPNPTPTRPPVNDNPQVRRNNVDSTIAWSTAVKESQDQVRKLLGKVFQATPKPAIPYAPADEEVSENVGAKTGMVKGTQHWVPIEARAAREYQAGGDEESEDSPKFLEIQVALNSTLGLTTGLATKSDKPHIMEIEGAMAVEQSTIPFVDSTRVDGGDTGRAPEEPMTLLRIYVVDPDLETHVRKLQKETGTFPGFGPAQVLADHPDEIRSIVISYYGPKSDVQAIARKIDVAALRKLLPS